MSHPENPQAFPTGVQGGMTLRDYFAAKAMQGLLTADWFQDDIAETQEKEIVRKAGRIADAMLIEREAKP